MSEVQPRHKLPARGRGSLTCLGKNVCLTSAPANTFNFREPGCCLNKERCSGLGVYAWLRISTSAAPQPDAELEPGLHQQRGLHCAWLSSGHFSLGLTGGTDGAWQKCYQFSLPSTMAMESEASILVSGETSDCCNVFFFNHIFYQKQSG